MLVSRLEAWGTAVTLGDRDPIGAVRQGEVVVDIEAAAVTHLDLTLMSGSFSYRPELPFTPGTAGVGLVTAGEAGLIGRRVLVRGAGIGLERAGTWAAQVAAPVEAVRAVPLTVDAALAATCYSPMTTAWAAAGPVGRIRSGERVLVTGASGAVGSLTVQMAARVGGHVIALVRNEKEAAAVPSAAAEIIADRDTEVLLDGGGIDVVLDTVGGDTVPALLPAVNPGGRIVMIGYVAGRTLTVDLPTLLAADVSLLPMNMVRRQVPDEVFHNLLTALADNTLHLNTTTYPFADISQVLTARTHGKVSGTLAVTL